MDNQKKISTVETVILFTIAGIAWAIDSFVSLAALMPVIGQVLLFGNMFVDFIVFAIIELWLIMKGGVSARKQSGAFAGNLLSFIPLANIIPFRLFGLGVSIYMINHPKAAQALSAKPAAGKKIAAKKETGFSAPEPAEIAEAA